MAAGARPLPSRDHRSPDDGHPAPDDEAVASLMALPGLAQTTARMLVGVGVRSPEDLDRLGPVPVYLRLRAAYSRVSLNFLYALEAIDVGCSWLDITPDRKAELRAEVARAQAGSDRPGGVRDPGARPSG
jgi:hypothetical protein